MFKRKICPSKPFIWTSWSYVKPVELYALNAFHFTNTQQVCCCSSSFQLTVLMKKILKSDQVFNECIQFLHIFIVLLFHLKLDHT